MAIKGAEADPDVSAATDFAPTPPDVPHEAPALDTGGGSEGRAIREEVARVMANPEVNGQPIALDFSSQGRKQGYSKKYASNWDLAFGKKKEEGDNADGK